MNDRLESLISELDDSQANKLHSQIKDLTSRKDLVIGVVGEFKRGKSSLINSIIQRDLLPSDILPATAAICIIKSSLEEEIILRYTDGRLEHLQCEKSVLERISRGGDINSEEIRQATIKIKNSTLKDLIFIDTPGVNDLSEFRIQLTYEILPNCDVLLFLLDPAAPLKKTEAKFLEEKILSFGINEILFILSKIDQLSSEELVESVEGARERILQITQREPIILLHSSVIDSLMYCTKMFEKLEDIRQKAISSRKQRIEVLESRIIAILSDKLKDRIKDLEQKLDEDSQKVRETSYETGKINLNITSWLNSVRSQFELIVDRLGTDFKNQTEIMISDYTNELKVYENNPEKFIKMVLPGRLERDLIRFTKSIEGKLSREFELMSDAVGKSAEKQFGLSVDLKLEDISGKITKYKASVDTFEDHSIIQRGASAVSGLIIGSMIFPGIGSIIGSMVGVLGSELMTRKLNTEMKDKILHSLPIQIEATVSDFQSLTLESIRRCYSEYENELKLIIESKQSERKNLNEKNLSLSLADLQNRVDYFKNLLNELMSFPKYLTR